MSTDVLEATLRPFGSPSRRWRLLVAALSALVLLGLVAWVVQLREGMGVAGYTNRSFWAIYIADVVAFIGVSYGGAVVSAILMLAGASWRAPLVRIAEGVALVTVLIGAAFIIPHLGRPDRLLGMVTHANFSSPVFWDMVAILTYTFATIVFFVLPLIPDTATLLATRPEELGRFRRALYAALSRGWVGSEHQRKVLHSAMTTIAIVIIPVAVSVHSVLSWAFSLVSRPGWHESIWAPYFVIAALYSGVALVIVALAAFRRGYRLQAFITERHFVRLSFIMVVLGATYVYLTFADLLPSAYVGEYDSSQIIEGMLTGRVAVWFWLFVVLGTVLPLVIVAVRRTRTVTGIVVASALVLVGMWLKRVIMVVETAGYDRLTNSFGELFHFTWVSASATLGGVAAVALLLMLLFRVFPLLAITEMSDLGSPPADPAPAEADPAAAAPRKVPVAVARGGAVLLVLLGIGATWSAAAPTASAATPAPPTAQPTVVVTATEDGQKNTLKATVTLAGKPVNGALVTFYEDTTMFKPGHNLVPVGALETDATGVAQVTYVAAVLGTHTITARYYPDPLGDPVDGTTQLEVKQVMTGYTPTPMKPLESYGATLVAILFSLVALVVLILGAQVVRVRRACRTA